jgi:hypothetical protein
MLIGRQGRQGRQASSFCEQKEAKKIFIRLVPSGGNAGAYALKPANGQKFFWFFFFKKRTACLPRRA